MELCSSDDGGSREDCMVAGDFYGSYGESCDDNADGDGDRLNRWLVEHSAETMTGKCRTTLSDR